MQRDYELMYIVRPELDEDALRATSENVQSMVENLGGEVVKTTPWGKRRLAYEVQHLRDGHYVLLDLKLDGTRVTDVERALRIHDTVFRHLLVAKDPAAVAEPPDAAAEPSDGAAAPSATHEPTSTEPAADAAAPHAEGIDTTSTSADDTGSAATPEPVGAVAGADTDEED